MSWVYLIAGILFEVAGTLSLKVSHGFSRLGPAILTVVFYAASILALAITLKQMPAGVAYAVWSALGTVLVVAVGMLWFKEPATAGKIFPIALIVAGTVWLNLVR